MTRVVVTGIGIVTSLGIGVEECWKGLTEGRSGVSPIKAFDASSLRTRVGGEVPAFDPLKYVAQRRSLRMMTRNDQLALAGATLALQDSGLDPKQQDSTRFGLFVGSSKEVSDPMRVVDGTLASRRDDGTADLQRLGEVAMSSFYPLFYVEGLQAASLFYISQAFDLKGANTYFAGTAETGLVAVGRAFRAIKRGEADMALAGAFDDAVSWWNMTKYDAMGLLTERNDLGNAACRPYDQERDGTVLGEGSAFLLLERYDQAVERGARIYAEITGFGSGYDAYKLVTPHPEGRGLSRAIEVALREAGTSPQDVGYISSHGSGTTKGDASEAHALRHSFDGSANTVAGSSVKPATGDLLAGAGALNAAVAALTVYHQVAPPTLNLEHLDPDCAMDWIPHQARDVHTDQALALARGLEGQNVALSVRAVR